MLTTILSGGLIGLIFGFILQRTRFCLTGGFRDMYIARNNTLFYAFSYCNHSRKYRSTFPDSIRYYWKPL